MWVLYASGRGRAYREALGDGAASSVRLLVAGQPRLVPGMDRRLNVTRTVLCWKMDRVEMRWRRSGCDCG
jgi:hypothetical protein